jgi:hypothetical protein
MRPCVLRETGAGGVSGISLLCAQREAPTRNESRRPQPDRGPHTRLVFGLPQESVKLSFRRSFIAITAS